MTDLEEVLDTPHGDHPGDLPEVNAVEKRKRKTYNHAIITELREALLHTQVALQDAHEMLAEANAENTELRARVRNQEATVAAEHETAEWAVAEAWGARRALADHASGAVIAYIVVGALSIISWEMLAHIVAAVTG
jgi:hypothetical protein